MFCLDKVYKVHALNIDKEVRILLEELYSAKYIRDKPIISLLLGLGYGIIGIGCAVLLFPEDPAIVAVAFTAILFLPVIRALFEQGFDFQTFIKTYALLFIGVLLAFSFFALVLPKLATNFIFKNQLEVMYGVARNNSRHAFISMPLFWNILANNLIVMMLCFITAFTIGDGGLLLIIWNASVWGIIFGNVAKNAALAVGKSPIIYFILVFIAVFPHMMLEAIAYFHSSFAGAELSRGLSKHEFGSPEFKKAMQAMVGLMILGLIILVLASVIEVYVLQHNTVYRTILAQQGA